MPVVLVAVQLRSVTSALLERGAREVDLDAPTGIVKCLDLDAVLVLPVVVALTGYQTCNQTNGSGWSSGDQGDCCTRRMMPEPSALCRVPIGDSVRLFGLVNGPSANA